MGRWQDACRVALALAWLTLFVLAGMTAEARAAERVPLRVAQFSWQVQSRWEPPASLMDRLETRLERALHVPLNGVLGAVEYIPEAACEAALADVMAELSAGGSRARLKEAMKPLAERLDADLVVYPALEGYEQFTYMGWGWRRGGPRLHSYVALRIAGYDRRRGETFYRGTFRRYDDDYASSGEAAQLARECLEQLLAETHLHDRISPRGAREGG